MLNSKYRFHSRGGVKYTYRNGKTFRRPVYEAIRLNFHQLKPSRDYIFVVYDAKVKDLPFTQLEKLLRSLIEESMIQ